MVVISFELKQSIFKDYGLGFSNYITLDPDSNSN